MLITAQILLTIATLGYSAIPSFFDFNSTHATNPSWTGHARYHVVWQVTTFDYIAVMALFLIWTAGTDVRQLWVPAFLALFAYGGFWTANFTRPMYKGVLQDEVNGVPEFHYNIFGWKFSVDANISLFTPITIITLVALWMVAKLNGVV
ncbi:MAG: hypothetical protein KDI50_06960 [Candidatus Competibacteraceae bacterium]|nr:hypothetical protein [Candidatus Competibacteraceae bacterium]